MRPAVVHLIGGGAVLRVEPQAAVVGREERVVGGLVAQARIGIMGDTPLAGSSKFETDAGRPFDFQAAIRQFANSRPIFRLPFPADFAIVEIRRQTFVPASFEDEMRHKVAALKLPRGIAVRTALVHDGDVAPELAENRFIDFIVPVERLFDATQEQVP